VRESKKGKVIKVEIKSLIVEPAKDNKLINEAFYWMANLIDVLN